MDPVRKQRRITLASVIAVFVVICGFWAVFISHTQAYKTYRLETHLRETLREIKPPAGAQVLSIKATHSGAFAFGMGIYSADSEFEKVKSHYLNEFPRHGFVYKGEDRQDTPQGSQLALNFCASGYEATLSPEKSATRPLLYMILIHQKGGRC